ncbi:acetyl-CoA hydrolase/transferase family protein [Panacibacter sp. DH6]|uniref:Acetyl-CoA hydrolase/transferase family protein n=1 Tax=Panacibacter microcysteis TaxID=2793269 RepID=A0A931GSP9_9BACT|nr:acetyl-CoA hydrolase/transferase family protein [Panacibacter microcysteis]MBG9374651.1 acetyl-CoA hydrolase/transferase family protein [Panacibacter microcysteis]
MRLPDNYVSPKEALAVIQSNQRVFIHGSAHTPTYLLKHLAKEADRLEHVEVVCISVYGELEIDKPVYRNNFHVNSLFVSASVRNAVKTGNADYVPIFLSEIPELFKQRVLPIDVAIVHVSVPDEHGYCSLGTSVDIARSAVNTATYIIAQVNPNAPRTHGDGMIHMSRFHAMVYCEDALHETNFTEKCGPETEKIGALIAALIDDKSTIQMGIGAIPDAVLQCLHNHKDLGVHTEMCSDGIIDLCEKDVINNKYKKIHPNKSVSSFALGSKRLYDYVNNNPSFAFLDIDYVNDPHIIRRNNKMVAINSAIEIDITGQVCSDSIGTTQFSGVGGQMDFMRGAALSEGGKPIIAIPSRTNKGIARIVPMLKPGAGVVTTRAHVHFVVTEYGVVNLWGKNLRQRAKALISIANPEDRETLDRAYFERFTN